MACRTELLSSCCCLAGRSGYGRFVKFCQNFDKKEYLDSSRSKLKVNIISRVRFVSKPITKLEAAIIA